MTIDTPQAELTDTDEVPDEQRDVHRDASTVDDDCAPAPRRRMSIRRQSLLVGITMIVAVSGVAGWLGWRAYEAERVSQQRAMFLAAGRQGALNLTSIDWRQADADVQRVLNSATGAFHDDFANRAKPLIEVVKQVQSTSQGTVTAAGLESATANDAQVLVAVSVRISNAGAAEQKPRLWRMRISVQKVGQEVKVSNVEFVP
ncbi:hypothetical protein AWC05_08270 [Mycobacterium florentinum]|uniref:Mce protein n=1 Tax=Mycobacterium florentinum TaxID=292462 RepID=A0A1X1UL17_MYCFL|nr:hypothetical protein [Mycobacterium florentinum]MCV7408187.1 mammalian cell entry protein [Mycobacterium florentinum]ORV57540.1 hypothetical protein AWC05_08270 [Mycobacterium florentinum]BBX78594.1 hypothetical protein MFLOJ_23810 [Mycobacterium florentinum]